MRVGVIGAGAVGGAIAALLVRGGHEVEVTARGAHLAAIRSGGIRLTGGWGDYTAQVEASEVLGRAPELVVVATKAQDSAAALRDNAALLRGTPLVIVQNGLDGIRTAKPLAPKSDVVGALALFASSYLSPGEITITATGHTYLGGDDPDNDIPARYAARVLSGVMPVSVIANFAGAQWTKLVINQVNALPAITGLSAQETILDRPLGALLTRSMQETVRVARRSHVTFESLQGLSNGRLRLFSRAPVALARVLPRLMAQKMGTVPNPGSTLQSIRRGQLTEIDYLNGAVVRAAQAVGMPAPINSRIVELVHEVERRGSFLAPADVLARF
jgi:2-dehydropantoate 2-reductase